MNEPVGPPQDDETTPSRDDFWLDLGMIMIIVIMLAMLAWELLT